MLLGKKRKLGREIKEMNVGEKLALTEKIEDKDILLYLGLTDDANPLFIQHDYASQTPFQKTNCSKHNADRNDYISYFKVFTWTGKPYCQARILNFLSLFTIMQQSSYC